MTIDFNNLQINALNPQSAFEKKVVLFIAEFLNDSPFVQVQSSGSTGTPKIFSVEKSKMKNSAAMTCQYLNLNEKNTALLCLPVENISGKMMVVRAIYARMKLIIKNPDTKPLKQINEFIDFCAMTPLQTENSLHKIHLIKKTIIGGAAVSESLRKKIQEVLPENHPTEIYETYGMTETLSHIALKSIFPQTELYFTALNGIFIDRNENNCLKILAPQLADGWLETNDVVEIKNDNKFRFLGRTDHIINSGGAKIFPEMLEAIVKKNIDAEVVFSSLKDDSLGHKLVAIVEGEESAEIRKQILAADFEKRFYRPKEIIFLPIIPRTNNGKIDRNALQQTLHNLY